MRFQFIVALGLVALASGTPLLDKKQPSSSLKVIDIPADLFADASENTEDVKPVEAASPAAVAAAPVEAKVPEVEEKIAEEKVPVSPPEEVAVGEDKKEEVDAKLKPIESGDSEEDDRPNVFGFRLPTIVIMRRPAFFDDNPFSSFPFFGNGFSRRPEPALVNPDRRVETETREGLRPVNAPSETGPGPVRGQGSISDVMFNMRQQMDSLFSSLFAPNPGYFPNRQFFPRPFFPSVPDTSEEDSDSVDFSKLPDNYKNSTHETKVVDGRVIEVNKTVQKIGGGNGFLHFSVIKIRPSEAPETVGKPETEEFVPPAAIEEKVPEHTGSEVTTVKAEQEAEMNNPSLNEVDQDKKDSEIKNTKYETDPGLLEEPTSGAPVSLPLTQEVVYDFVPLKAMPLIEASKGSGKAKPHDLSSDLRVNNLMANSANGRFRSLVDPDEIEVIEV